MEIELPCYDIVIVVEGDGGWIKSSLPEDIDYDEDGPEDTRWKEDYNHMVDAVMSMILAHACAGIDVQSHGYVSGIETAVEACSQYDCLAAGDGS